MNRREFERAAARVAARSATGFLEDVERLRADAGITQAALARASGIDPGFLHRILAGKAEPSVQTRARLAVALGADLSSRLYPNTGPLVRDRHQAAIAETLLSVHHPRWHPFSELRVTRPSRGWIDLALHEPRERVVVAAEIQSELHRLEQLIRWSEEKARSLPSWDGWASLGDAPAISRLLIVRRTRATRAVVADFERQLRLAYPAHPDDALAALTATVPWPGPALIWAETAAGRVRLVAGR